MLVGREPEQGALRRLLREARAGSSGVLVLLGDPGIGKSELLDYARRQGGDFTVLRARGVQSEAKVPFGGLLELLRPILSEIRRIPEPQADALAMALALRPGRAAGFHEVIALARGSRQRADLACALSRLAWLEARQGDEQSFRVHASAALEVADELGLGLCDVWTATARGELELGRGDPRRALESFDRVVELLESRHVGDADLFPGPELVEANLRLGNRAQACAVASRFARLAGAKGQPWALARAERGLGLVASGEEMVERFTAALDHHAATPDHYEEARTRLAYGSSLRRERQRAKSREQLRSAIDLFDALGARPLAERARRELAASGETARRRDPSTLRQLTPQELQIGLLLVSGRTTRDAAAALFLSPKTIEYHLRNAYRKLGISSREELAEALARASQDRSALNREPGAT